MAIVFWIKELKIIIQNIIKTLETKKPDIDFYKNIVQNTDQSRECKPDVINGWIIKFIPYDKDNNKCDFDSPDFNGLNVDQIPTQIVNLPFHLITANKNGINKQYEAEFYTGFFGVKQDEKTLSIKPIIGYAIVEVIDKKKIIQEKAEEQLRINLAMEQLRIRIRNFDQ